MGRLRRPSPDEVTPEVRDAFIKLKAERGNIPNMFRTIAHRPEIAATLLAHYRAVMGPGTVPIVLKEMLAVRVSRLNSCDY